MRGAIKIILVLVLGIAGCSTSGKPGDTPLVPLPSPPITGAYPIDIDFAGLPNGPLDGPTNIGGVDVDGNDVIVNDGTIQLNPGELFFGPPDTVSEVALMVNAQSQSSTIIGLDEQDEVVSMNFTWRLGDFYFFTISDPNVRIKAVQLLGPDSKIERAIFSRPFSFIEFERDGTYPIAASGADMAVADFDADGAIDLALTSPSESFAYIVYGNGLGGIDRTETVVTAAAPDRIIAADINNDGRPDLIVTLPSTKSVEVFVNLGGSFAAGVTYIADSLVAVAAADIDGDGVVDLATGGPNGVGLFFNNGAGTFGGFQPIPGLTGSVADISLADMDLDKKADLVVSLTSSNSIEVWKGDGAGAFAKQPGSISLGAQSSKTLAVRTLDWDKYPDVVTTLTGSPNFKSWLNDKSGGFDPMQSFQAVTGAAADIILPDINADGFADMAIADADNGNIALFVGKLMGQFQIVNIIDNGPSPAALGSGDFDGDHRNDIMALDQFGAVHIYLNRSY